MLGYLFNYDYTLEESGIQKSEETNQQVTLMLNLNPNHRFVRSKASAIQNTHTLFYEITKFIAL